MRPDRRAGGDRPAPGRDRRRPGRGGGGRAARALAGARRGPGHHHGRRYGRAAVGGGKPPRRRDGPLLRGRRRHALAPARDALSPRAHPHRHVLFVAVRPRRGVPADRRGRGFRGRARHPPRVARRPRPRRGPDAAPRGAQGVRDAVRAMVFHGPGDLRAEELPVPEPETGELVLRIEAALTCGTDVKTLRRGHPVMIPKVPTVFGHEFAGTIAAVGAGVSGFREGDRVVAANSAPCGACRSCLAGRPNLCEDLLFVNGAYGEFIALPPRLVSRNVVALPRGVPASRAAFAEPLACAMLGVERARVSAGHTVAIFGHGPLGCLLAMVAASEKARVIIVGKAGWRFEHVRALGLGECLDATAGDVLA